MDQKDKLLDGIPVFVEVVRRGGFSAAAETLGRSASHVSKEVTRLEERLGMRLLQRTTRSITLTEEGRAYFETAEQIVDLATQAEAAAAGAHDQPHGTLKIAAPMSYALNFLNPILPKFTEQAPEVQLDVDLNDRRSDVIGEGFDLALRIGEMPDSSLIARKLGAFRGVVVGAPALWDRYGRPTHPRELTDVPCTGYSNVRFPNRWSFPDGEGEMIDVTVPLLVRSNSGALSMDFVRAGKAAARLPDFFCCEEIRSGKLEVVLEDFERDPIPLWAVYPHRAHVTPKVRAFVEFLERELSHSR